MNRLSSLKNKILLLAPTVIFYSLFIILPIFMSFAYSLTKYTGIGSPEYVGPRNYEKLFRDPFFFVAVKNTLIILVIAIVVLMVGGFFLALLLNQRYKGINTIKALCFSPAIIAPIVVGIIWIFILDPEIGLINNVLRTLGLDKLAQTWIGGKTLTPYVLGFVFVWQQIGYIATIFLAGLKIIPSDVFEAARLDGATGLKKIWYVTLPMIKGTIITCLVLVVTNSMKIFEIVLQLTNGGPNHYSETLITYSYFITFTRSQYGYGMAMASVTFVICIFIMQLIRFATRHSMED